MKRFFSKKLLLILPVLLIMAGLLATAIYFYQKYQSIKKNPDIVSKEEVKSVTEAIGKFMELPSDEDPTLATVTDQEKLKEQDFFKKALNGDKVLIYTKAHKAILYRPSTNRIIEFAPLTFGAQEQATASPTPQAEPIKVAIYNGTKVVGLTADYEKTLAGISSLAVVAKVNAAKSDYTKTIVFDVSGKNQDMVSQVAQLLGGDVVTVLPTGETKPQADILIITGK